MTDPKLDPVPTSTAEEEIDLRRLWDALRRNRWLVLGTTILMAVAATLFAALQRPLYEGEATILIAEERPGLDLLRGMIPGGAVTMAGLGAGGSDIQTDIAVLRSRQVAEGVVDSLALRVTLLERNASRDLLLRVLTAGQGTGSGIYRLQRVGNGAYSLHLEAGDSPPRLPDHVEIGQPFRLDDVTLSLAPALRANPPERIRFQIQPYRDAVEEVQSRIRVVRPVSGAQIVKVHFRDPDPVLAAAVPNVVTQSFLRYKNRVSKAESHSTIEFLEQQSASYEADLRMAEARLQGFREQAQIVEPKTQATEQIRRLAELQAERDALQAERESLRRLLARLDARPPVRAAERSPYRELAAFPTFIANGTVQNILQSLIQLENQRAELIVRRTPQSIDVQGIDERIGELELQLYQLAQNYLNGVENRALSLDALFARSAGQADRIPAREVEFHRLAREQGLLEEVYTLIQTKLKEAQIQAASEPANVRLVDSALVPKNPASPRPLLYLLIAMALGLMTGVGGALVREYLDDKVRTRADVAHATSGLPVLGAIPQVPVPAVNGSGRRLLSIRRIPARALLEEPLVTRKYPYSPASEAYRALRTNIMYSGGKQQSQVLVVTSASAEDGKSTSSSNLAITLAQQGSRTLLVDADLRRGRLHRLFGIPQEPGLSDVISGRASFEEVIQRIPLGDSGAPLDLLASGALPPNPAELVGSPAMRELLAWLRERYEITILDAPPLNLVTDAAVVGTSADSIVLVARAGITDKRALQDAVEQLRHLRIPVGGVVLNGLDREKEYYGRAPASWHVGQSEN